MLQHDPSQYLPSPEDLPHSDETPVDSELQDLIPHLLKAILAFIWQDRTDWFFGVDMGVYYDSEREAIVPDGFLSLGVERFIGTRGRLSYMAWRENGTIPILVIEVVSQTYRGEYKQKKIDYAEMGALYYVIYDANRSHSRRGEPFEVHRLVDGVYVRCAVEPVWMPEIGLSIGREIGTYQGWTREWLYWYDEEGRRFATPDELRQQEARTRQLAEQQLEQERQRAEQLAVRLRELGIDPDEG